MKSPTEEKIAIVLYSHPEFFPPVLNVIDSLSKVFDGVIILSRNLKSNQWAYPTTVVIKNSGKLTSIRDSEVKPLWWKIQSFLRFTYSFLKLLRSERPAWVICNDPISLWAFSLIRPLIGYSAKLWYHNHDISELESMRKYSIGYFAVKAEANCLSNVDLFTIPSIERLKFFRIEKLKGNWFVIPNYPSMHRTTKIVTCGWKPGEKLKLIYQGRISNEHGLEEIIDFAKTDPGIYFTIIGPGDENYVRSLKSKVIKMGISDRIVVLDPVAYGQLQKITTSHHVGVAVNKPVNIQYSTGALASNKIYEYAAAGLPIIYYNDKHYLEFLTKYEWAFPSDLTNLSLAACRDSIQEVYSYLSKQARTDFESTLNFENVFQPVIKFLTDNRRVQE